MLKKENQKIIQKFENKLQKINNDLNKTNNNIKRKIRQNQKTACENTIRKFKHYKRIVSTYEHCNNKQFNGTVADVCTFNDLISHCNELTFSDDTPLDLILNGVYIPIGGSAIAPYDLREYLYLPSSLVESIKLI